MNQDIDFVITYVDGNDISWQKEKNKYSADSSSDINPNRYREWNNLQYLFRGIEQFAPWVRKIHFVTYGHIPKWLNQNHPKLTIVKHEDYIPQKWLPTFNNRCIELNLHRIPNLSEQFVYFNDDMFLTSKVNKEDFFKNGKPCDTVVLFAMNYTLSNNVALHLAPVVDTAIINKHFSMRSVICQHPWKWINYRYGKYNMMTISLLMYHHFTGFLQTHLPYSYLKSTFESVWEIEPGYCETSSMHKFRNITDINQWLMNYWQYATNDFYPRSISFGKAFQIHTSKDAEQAASAINKQQYKTVCVNDVVDSQENFDYIASMIHNALDSILHERSGFELPEK